jgi:hypothetical protein
VPDLGNRGIIYLKGNLRPYGIFGFSEFLTMPVISIFYGILIRMFFDEHAPPHFHAEYGEFKASINIQTLEVFQGTLPRRAQELVLDWAELHQNDLFQNWELCRNHKEPHKIEPLK